MAYNNSMTKFPYHFVLGVVVFGLTIDLPFFWDSIQLASKQANYVFTSGSWLLPDEIDSGHPPGFGIYLSSWWHLLGRELWVSHLSMLPFTVLLFHQLISLCKRIDKNYWPLLLLVVLCEPVLLGQLCLVSPDIALLALLLLLINAVLANNRWLATLAILGLSLISTRAWMLVILVYLVDLLHLNRPTSWRAFWQLSLPYAIGSIPAQVYLVTHYMAKGWIGYHEASPWVESLETVPIQQMVYNVGIMGWRLLDYGKIAVWLLLLWQLIVNRKQLLSYIQREKTLLFLWVGCLAVIAIAIIPRNGIVGPRYLLPGIVFFHLWVIKGWINSFNQSSQSDEGKPLLLSSIQQKAIYFLVIASLIGGSFWVYPFRVAQAWDATPLHVIYHEQEAKALDWLQEQHVAIDQVGSVFPSIGPIDNRRLNGKSKGFIAANMNEEYLFVSSIHNDWSDQAIDLIEQQYEMIKEWRNLNVFSRIYKKR